MNNGELYLKANDMQRRDSSEILEEFGHLFNWRQDGMNSLLDIGCGPGDVLNDFVRPKTPKNCKITGVDISEAMIRCAREKFGGKSMEFKTFDISSVSLCQQLNNEQFDNITSFFSLNWIQNQEQTFANIHQLLRQNGTAIISFVTEMPLFYDVFEFLARFQKYKMYFKNVGKFMSPYRREKHPQKLVENYCNSVGLKLRHIEIRDTIYAYKSSQQAKDAAKAANPFTELMQEKLQNEFMNDFAKFVKELCEKIPGEEEKLPIDYKLVIAIMTK